MPFSSQPRKKGVTRPQAKESLSCGHTSKQNSCPICMKKIVDLPTTKNQIAILQEQIAKKLLSSPKSLEKAAFVLSEWLKTPGKK